MESPLTQIHIPLGQSLDDWNEAYAKVERYLTALRLRNKFLLGQYVYRILGRATRRARIETGVAPTELAMEEAVKAINDWVGQVLGSDVADTPHRIATQGRLAMLLAVMHRHAGLQFFDQDIFINAVGGVRISEPAADLAIVLAMVSSLRNKRLPKELVVFGEIGLSGELRPAPRGQERLREAAKLGFTHAIVPASNAPKQPIDGIEVIGVDRVEKALAALRDKLDCF